MNNITQSNKKIILYYSFLMAIVLVWSGSTTPPMPLRMVFLTAVMIPLYGNYRTWLPLIVPMFMVVSSNHYAPSVMISLYETVLIPIGIGVLLFIPSGVKRYHCPNFLYFFIVYFLVIDLFDSGHPTNIFYILIFVCCFFLYLDRDDVGLRHRFSIMFMLVSTILSLELFIVGPQHMSVTNVMGDTMERIGGWVDPNYFACTLGMGAVAALIELFRGELSKRERYLAIVTLFVSIAAIPMTGSRGGVLALAVAAALLIVFSDIKGYRKLLYVFLIVAFVFYLLYSGHLSLLIAKLTSDDKTGGERTVIWEIKIKQMIADNNSFRWLFGYGYDGGLRLGYGRKQGFHNDYVAFLSMYGIIGLLYYFALLLYPLRLCRWKKVSAVASVAFLAVASVSLEPMSAGNIFFYLFWMYTIILACENERSYV